MAEALAVIAGGFIAGLVGLLTVRHERRLDRRLRIFEELIPTILTEVDEQATHSRLSSPTLRAAVSNTTRSARVAGWDEYQAAFELGRLIDERDNLMVKIGNRLGSDHEVIQVSPTADPALLEMVKERDAIIASHAASLGALVERRVMPRRSLSSRLRETHTWSRVRDARLASRHRKLTESTDSSRD